MCLEEIGLHAQNMITILGSIVYIVGTWEDMYDRFMSTTVFTLTMNKIIHMSSRCYEENGYDLNQVSANHLTLITCFITKK